MGQPGRRAGFTLVEVLVALVVAGLFLTVLGRAMAGAWRASRAPMDVVSALVLARDAALGAPADVFRAARQRGYSIDRTSGPVDLVPQASRLAPAPADAKPEASASRSTPSNMLLAEPKGLVIGEASMAKAQLRRVSVVIGTPSGRRLTFETVRLDYAAE